MAKKLSKSRAVGAKTLFAAFEILKENGGEMRGRDVIEQIRERVEFTDWEKERYEKTGYIRWESILHFFTIDCIKAGFMQKNKGTWILTEEGEEAISLGSVGLLEAAKEAYLRWKAKQDNDNKTEEEDDTFDEEDPSQQQEALLQRYEDVATEGILDFIKSKNPYEFQDMVASLLKAMGYYVPHVAKRGKDGGIDLIAYTDPLGTKAPRIKVQVKHRPEDAVSVDVVRQLVAVLNKEGDVGIFVTSGRFTSDSERYSRESHKHIELIDFERFVSLWQEFYDNMADEQKNMLPLHPIYFLGSNE